MNGLNMIETLKANGAESDFFSKWAGYQARVATGRQRMELSSTQHLSLAPMLLGFFANIAILAMGGLKIMNGQMSIGMLVAFQSLMASFMGPANQLVNMGGVLQETRADMERLDDVMRYGRDRRFTRDNWAEAGTVPIVVRLSGRVELDRVTYGYSPLEPPIIEDFGLTVEPGSRVALVGASGSGKSTLAKLITGLFEPWEGDIALDGRSMAGIPSQIHHANLAMVDQEIFMFEGTVRENLTMWDDTTPEKDVVRAAKDACIHEEIAARSGGYASRVAEGSRNFSGGERQRLEIARALVNNPAILVLDEATSALDPASEKTVNDNIRRRGCTCIIVAHRLSAIKDCDEIVVIDEGRIVQRGLHEELNDVEGPYSELIRSR